MFNNIFISGIIATQEFVSEGADCKNYQEKTQNKAKNLKSIASRAKQLWLGGMQKAHCTLFPVGVTSFAKKGSSINDVTQVGGLLLF